MRRENWRRWAAADRGAASRYHSPMPAPAPDTSLIHARGLTKRFKLKSAPDGLFTAVDAVDFDVAPGEAFGFLGPNGAGKTSTMRMISAVSPRSGGELTVLGIDPDKNGAQIRARLGRGASARHARHRADRAREPAHLRPLLRPDVQRGAASARWSCSTSSSCSERANDLVEPLVGRHEAAPDHRPLTDQRAAAAAPRRAHHRASIRRRATWSGIGCTGSSSRARRSC